MFWLNIPDTPELASQFSASNLNAMKKGRAPIAMEEQWVGKNKRYNLHHRQPINQGGAVYAVDNVMVTTPRFHKEVLSPDYHY